MSHEHDHVDDCDCDHHKPGGHTHDSANPCRVEMLVENLLKNVDIEKDTKEE